MTDRFFLKSAAIENLKSVQRSGTVAFTPLTVFIGNNGSGKSSLIEALETYRTMVLDGLDAAMGRWRGIEYVWNQRASHRRKTAQDGRETWKKSETVASTVLLFSPLTSVSQGLGRLFAGSCPFTPL